MTDLGKKFLEEYVPSGKFNRRLLIIEKRVQSFAHKEIAEIFFNKDRVKEEWPDPDGHVRTTVDYAIGAAKDLMEGEYLKFLHKPDS